MTQQFSQTSLTTLDDFITVMIRNSFTFGQPVQVEYRSTGLFNPSSIFLPTVRELDGFVTKAFTGNDLANYLQKVQGLPKSNIFSTTTVIDLTRSASVGAPTSQAGASGTNTTTAAIAAGAAGIVVLAAGLIILRRRRQEDGEFDEDYGTKEDQGDATVAGETCNLSVDASSEAPSWRRCHHREFEDKPLGDPHVDDDDGDDDESEIDGDAGKKPIARNASSKSSNIMSEKDTIKAEVKGAIVAHSKVRQGKEESRS